MKFLLIYFIALQNINIKTALPLKTKSMPIFTPHTTYQLIHVSNKNKNIQRNRFYFSGYFCFYCFQIHISTLILTGKQDFFSIYPTDIYLKQFDIRHYYHLVFQNNPLYCPYYTFGMYIYFH